MVDKLMINLIPNTFSNLRYKMKVSTQITNHCKIDTFITPAQNLKLNKHMYHDKLRIDEFIRN